MTIPELSDHEVVGVRIIRRILLLALLLVALEYGIEILLDAVVLPQVVINGGFDSILLFNLWSAPLLFIVSPVLVLVVFYLQARRHDFRREYASIALSLFAGGFVAGVLYYIAVAIVVFILTGYHVPGFPSYLLSSAKIALVIAGVFQVLLALIREGLSMMFTGFFAFALADLRKRESSSTLQPGPLSPE